MPNQSDPTQNPNPAVPSTDAPISPIVPPIISPQVDLPPLSPDFQNLPQENGTPTVDKNNGSAAPPDISSVIPKAKKKFGGGRIIATILGLIVLVGGVGAGIILTQQQQLFQQKAAIVQCQSDSECPSTQFCKNGTCTIKPTTTVADGQCLGPGQTCTSGKSYTDNSCIPTDTRCGIKECGTGLNCSTTSQPAGSSPCRRTDYNITINCCPNGQIISNNTCTTAAATTIADGQCLGPGQTCTSGKSYTDNSCIPTDTRCGTKSVTTIADGQCLGPGQTCTSGKSYTDNSCIPTDTRCGINPTPVYCATLGAGLVCGPVGGPAITGATYCNQSSGNTYCCPAGQTISGTSCVAGGSTAQCTRITNPTNLNGGNITITSQVIAKCTAACLDASGVLYASKFICDGINLTTGCQNNGVMLSTTNLNDVITVSSPTCGTVQYDVGCKNSANTWGTIVFSSKQAATACSTTTSTSSSPTAPSCIAVKAYSDTWIALTPTQLSAETVGSVVNFCVGGSAPTGTFDKAQFMVNTVLKPETTTVRSGSSDFCQSYTILPTDTTVTVRAKIHHAVSGWVGESI